MLCRVIGAAWGEAEHRMFLLGLKKLGKVRVARSNLLNALRRIQALNRGAVSYL